MSAWVKQHKLFLALFALILAAAVLAVVMWNYTRPPVTSLWKSFDEETRTLTLEAGLGYTIDSFTVTDAGTGVTVSLTAPPFQYRIDGAGPLEMSVQYREREGAEVHTAQGSASIAPQPEDGWHSMAVHLPAIGTDSWGRYRIPETDPCPICRAAAPSASPDLQALTDAAFADPAGWAGGDFYVNLDRAALFAGPAEEGDPACAHPLSSGLAFVLPDGADLSPEEAAARLTGALLDYYSTQREGCPFRVTAYAVEEQTLMDRAALRAMAEEAVSSCGTEEEAAGALAYLQGEYPLLGEDMWCLFPDFRLAWEGELSTLGAMPQGEELMRVTPDGSPGGGLWVLIRYDGQYWLQRSAALAGG